MFFSLIVSDEIHCLYTVHCTLYTVHCILKIVHSTFYTVHCILKIVHSTFYIVHSTCYTVHCKVYSVKCTLYSVYCTLYTVWISLCCHDFMYTKDNCSAKPTTNLLQVFVCSFVKAYIWAEIKCR